jgi:hypothetical protein
MRLHFVGIALLAVSSALAQPTQAQTQSGSALGANTGGAASANLPPPPAPPSTGTSADFAGTRGTNPRTETSAGTSGLTPDSTGRASGRCDTLIGDERQRCLREHASTGTTGPTSTGMGSGAAR